MLLGFANFGGVCAICWMRFRMRIIPMGLIGRWDAVVAIDWTTASLASRLLYFD
jgi:hypothetical protein